MCSSSCSEVFFADLLFFFFCDFEGGGAPGTRRAVADSGVLGVDIVARNSVHDVFCSVEGSKYDEGGGRDSEVVRVRRRGRARNQGLELLVGSHDSLASLVPTVLLVLTSTYRKSHGESITNKYA